MNPIGWLIVLGAALCLACLVIVKPRPQLAIIFTLLIVIATVGLLITDKVITT